VGAEASYLRVRLAERVQVGHRDGDLRRQVAPRGKLWLSADGRVAIEPVGDAVRSPTERGGADSKEEAAGAYIDISIFPPLNLSIYLSIYHIYIYTHTHICIDRRRGGCLTGSLRAPSALCSLFGRLRATGR